MESQDSQWLNCPPVKHTDAVVPACCGEEPVIWTEGDLGNSRIDELMGLLHLRASRARVIRLFMATLCCTLGHNTRILSRLCRKLCDSYTRLCIWSPSRPHRPRQGHQAVLCRSSGCLDNASPGGAWGARSWVLRVEDIAESVFLLSEPPWKRMAHGIQIPAKITPRGRKRLRMWEGFQDSQEKGRVLGLNASLKSSQAET